MELLNAFLFLYMKDGLLVLDIGRLINCYIVYKIIRWLFGADESVR